MASVDADDDLGVAQADHVAVGQLPLLHRRVVHRGAVGGVEVGEQCDVAVPADLQVPPRDAGVGQPELGILAAADHVRALAQLVGAAAAVVELQGHRAGTGGRGAVAALVVAALFVATGRVVAVAAGGLAVLGLRGLAVALLTVIRLAVTLLAVVGLRGLAVIGLAVTARGCLAVVLLAVTAGRGLAVVGLGCLTVVGLLGCLAVAALVVAAGLRTVAALRRGTVTLLGRLAVVLLAVVGLRGLAVVRLAVPALAVVLLRCLAVVGSGRRMAAAGLAVAALGCAVPPCGAP